ncbi:MAG: DnaB-like helicase C-terminal domain-containing protein [bacterium]
MNTREVEQRFLASVLCSPDFFEKNMDFVASQLDENHFEFDEFRILYGAMKKLYADSKDLDVIELLRACKFNSKSEELVKHLLAEGISWITGKSQTVSAAKEIIARFIDRQILKAADELHKVASSPTDDYRGKADYVELIVDAANMIEEMEIGTQKRGIAHFVDQIDGIVTENASRGTFGIKSGFPWIDSFTKGLCRGHIWGIGGYTGSGKTSFVLQTMLNVLNTGARVSYFSLEMNPIDIVLRLYSMQCGIATKILEMGREKRPLALEKLKQLNLKIHDGFTRSVEAIETLARADKRSTGLDVLIVDFVQNLYPDKDIFESQKQAAVKLQHLAKKLDCTVIMVSQLSNESAKNANSKMIGFKGAGELGAVVDLAVIISREGQDFTADIKKSRFGKLGKFTYFQNIDTGAISCNSEIE